MTLSKVAVASAGQAAFNISMTGGGGYTGLTTLAVTGVPTGATATFTAPTLTAGQSTLLTVQTTGTTAASSYPLTVTATGLLNGVQTTRAANLTLQVQAAGQTRLTGQILDEDGKPLPGVTLQLSGATPTVLGTTDAAGNFLFPLSVVGSQIFIVDGSTAAPSGTYPTIAVTAPIVAGQANTLGYTPHLHRQPATQPLPVAPPTPTTLTFTAVPGLAATLPAGVTITGWDGQANTQMGARLVPLDRLAIPPPPANVETKAVYMFNFGKVGGGLPSAPVPGPIPTPPVRPPGPRSRCGSSTRPPTAPPPTPGRCTAWGRCPATGRRSSPTPAWGCPGSAAGAGSSTSCASTSRPRPSSGRPWAPCPPPPAARRAGSPWTWPPGSSP